MEKQYQQDAVVALGAMVGWAILVLWVCATQ